MQVNQKVVIIGGGFSSLSAACYLARDGFDVTIYEKNKELGGRARQLKLEGFTFDIGPTFYWMPDVFDSFFNDFGKKVSDYYHLERLNPGYQVYFDKLNSIGISDNLNSIKETFESIETGSALKLQDFIDQAASNYQLAIRDLVYQPGESVWEIINVNTAMKLGLFFKSIKKQVSEYFSDPRLKKIMEFPVLFLGAKPSNTPAFYNFMNYADFELGTWYPEGGMYAVVESMVALAKELKVKLVTDAAVEEIHINGKLVTGVTVNNTFHSCDILLSGADYVHTESLLPESARQYGASYWNKKTFAPSALLFYVGFAQKLKNVSHHTLFFDSDFEGHAKEIYDDAQWPKAPLFYASFPSISDSTAAPKGKEAGIFLIPIAPDLDDGEEVRLRYFDHIIDRLEKLTDQEVKSQILFKKSYCVSDFKADYNSFKGNAYGLANTLLQTHVLRPKLKSKKLFNLYFAGQLTVPGPGVPPSIISGKIVSELLKKQV